MPILIADDVDYTLLASLIFTLMLSIFGVAFVLFNNRLPQAKSEATSGGQRSQTWRLFIDLGSATGPRPDLVNELRVAIERKFQLSLSESTLSLVLDSRDRLCATLSLRTQQPHLLPTEFSEFQLELEPAGESKIPAQYAYLSFRYA